eukprot:Hpha_TRINITY_DN8937_c1_g1::TRINITY_DN8937_c1_g1_i1::g.80726::m.80726
MLLQLLGLLHNGLDRQETGTDLLSNPSSLTALDLRPPNAVQDLRLTRVDVTHHGADRGPQLPVRFLLVRALLGRVDVLTGASPPLGRRSLARGLRRSRSRGGSGGRGGSGSGSLIIVVGPVFPAVRRTSFLLRLGLCRKFRRPGAGLLRGLLRSLLPLRLSLPIVLLLGSRLGFGGGLLHLLLLLHNLLRLRLLGLFGGGNETALLLGLLGDLLLTTFQSTEQRLWNDHTAGTELLQLPAVCLLFLLVVLARNLPLLHGLFLVGLCLSLLRPPFLLLLLPLFLLFLRLALGRLLLLLSPLFLFKPPLPLELHFLDGGSLPSCLFRRHFVWLMILKAEIICIFL